jgi:hypothetical protein
MKNTILSTLFVMMTAALFGQGSRPCCPIVFRDTITYSEIQNLHTTPVTLFTPPVNGGVRFVKPAVMYNHCSASGAFYPSGEFIEIYNDANVAGVINQFTDPSVMVQGIYSAMHFQTYEVVRNGQPLIPGSSTILDGSIKIRSTWTSPIIGNPGDYWIIELVYDHLTF